MKYYTKEWMELAQKLDYTARLKPIEDKEYSDEEIQKLYKEEEKRYVREERECYNEPPFNFLEYLGKDNFEVTDICRVDEETGEAVYPKTKEEALEWSREDYEKELAEFEARPPFDEEKAKQEFREMYEDSMEASLEEFHRFLEEQVDKRLLALDLVPKRIFQKLEKIDEENEKRFNDLEKIAKDIFKNQRIPAKVEELFKGLHDGIIATVGERRGNILLKIFPEGANKPRIIKCIDAKLIENEIPDITNVENNTEMECYFLYDELYHNKDGYEVHIMAEMGVMDLRYLTIKCEDIVKGTEEDLSLDTF